MNQQDIIREWFYRLPNGYANPPYSKKEMNVLHEVLAENDVNGSIFAKEVNQPNTQQMMPERNFNNAYMGPNTPLIDASEPMAANEAFGGMFGGSSLF